MAGWLGLALLSAVLLSWPRLALAEGPNDAALRGIIEGIFEAEVGAGELEQGLQNLEAARSVCEGSACSPEAEAELLVAIGMVQAQLGRTKPAVKNFVRAQKLDPAAKLPEKYKDEAAEEAWKEAKDDLKDSASKGCRGRFKQVKKPQGWQSAEAYFCYREAKDAAANDDWSNCVADARASLDLEARLGTRAVFANCLERADRWEEAIQQYQVVAQEAPTVRQFTLAAKAKQRANKLIASRPSIIIRTPEGIDDLKIRLDGTEIPVEILDTEIPVDPGEHRVAATGKKENLSVGDSEDILAEPDDSVTVELDMTPTDKRIGDLLDCINSGKRPEDCVVKVEPVTGGDISVRISSEFSGYTDDMSVDVISPSVSTGLEHVTDGWGIGASFLIDVVTAASVDIVATASPRWREIRYVPAINGHVKVEDFDIAINGNLSHEPDYISAGGGVTLTGEFRQKTVVPSLGYSYSRDINGKAQTPFDLFGKPLNRHGVNAGLGIVLTKATFGSGAFTFVHEDGDTSKPYRHIPLFSPEAAARIQPGTTIDDVNAVREPERPLEQLPVERQRYALALGLAHRFSDSTLRISERLYIDSWGTKASTTDFRFLYDVLKEFRIWPHLRFHVQSGADFYQLAYVVTQTADGPLIPQIRTGDRELGPLYSVTGGAGARYDFGERRSYGLQINGDVVYSQFLDHLFVKQRFGFFGALAFDAEFE